MDRLKSKGSVSARDVARVAGYIVSARHVFDPMALLFTREMCVWVQSVWVQSVVQSVETSS